MLRPPRINEPEVFSRVAFLDPLSRYIRRAGRSEKGGARMLDCTLWKKVVEIGVRKSILEGVVLP